MKPKINVLVNEEGTAKAITREMTDSEYAEYLAAIKAENEAHENQNFGVEDEVI